MPTERVTWEGTRTGGGGPGRWPVIARAVSRRRRVVLGLVILAALGALAWGGPLVVPWDLHERDFTAFLRPPSAEHWFGTDPTGRDLFHATMAGLRTSLVIGLLVALISTAVAAVVGATAGYFLGVTDRVLMWITDLALVLPNFLVLAVLFPVVRGGDRLLLTVLLAAFMWMVTAKMVRGMAVSLRERDYVRAARYMGVPAWRIISRHILPNMSSLLIIDATINVGAAVIAETGLSYFGFGVQPPDVSLGTLIAQGTRHVLTHPWIFAFPAGTLAVLVLTVNLLGDGLRDALDPRSPARGR